MIVPTDRPICVSATSRQAARRVQYSDKFHQVVPARLEWHQYSDSSFSARHGNGDGTASSNKVIVSDLSAVVETLVLILNLLLCFAFVQFDGTAKGVHQFNWIAACLSAALQRSAHQRLVGFD